MARGAHEILKKNKYPARGLILLLLLPALCVGGVIAYLSASASLTNSFTPNAPATVTVNEDNQVTVDYQDYAVYLRSAVVVNWVKDGDPSSILGETPVLGTDYELTYDTKVWHQHSDGFFYYRSVIEADKTNLSVATITPKTSRSGYSLEATILAQTVQAVGTTDEDHTTPNKDAVFDAWGVEASEFIGKTNP